MNHNDPKERHVIFHLRNDERPRPARLSFRRTPVACLAILGVVAPVWAQAPAPPPPVEPFAAALRSAEGAQNQPGSNELSAGRAASMGGRWQEALDHYRTIVENYPSSGLADDAAFWSAHSLKQLGRYEEAVEWANRVLNDYPDSDLRQDARVVRFEAAEILVRQGNVDYQRYLREEAAPLPPRPPVPAAGQAPGAPAPAAPPVADVEADLRLMALDALIGMDPEEAWPLVERIVRQSDDPELRGRAIWLLNQIGTDAAFDLLVELARTEPDPEVRSNALFWVGQSDDHRDQALDLLIELADEGDDDISGSAMFGLGQSDDPRAREALEAFARDRSRSSEARGQALFWLSQKGEPSLVLLREMALNEDDQEIRGQALFGISQIDSPEATDVLLELARSDGPMDLRTNAIFWLGQRDDDRVVEVLIGLWNELDDLESQKQVLWVLSQTANDDAIDHLIAVAKDAEADAELRSQAVFWLGQSAHPRARQALIDIIGGAPEDRE